MSEAAAQVWVGGQAGGRAGGRAGGWVGGWMGERGCFRALRRVCLQVPPTPHPPSHTHGHNTPLQLNAHAHPLLAHQAAMAKVKGTLTYDDFKLGERAPAAAAACEARA